MTLYFAKMFSKVFVLLVAATAVLGGKLHAPSLFNVGGKIVGGSTAGSGEIPFQVSIQTSGGFQSCGGSIVNNRWILTAAHCSDVNPGLYRIRSGTLRYASGGDLHEISQIVVHASYQPNNNNNNDIALWQITDTFAMSSTTGTVGIPNQGASISAGTMCTVSGWGTTSYGGTVSEVLLKVDVPIVSKLECESNYANFGGIADNQICAGYANGGSDSCQGDSGGPLFRNGVQWGVVSWGNGCAWAGFPGVYTEVASYADWIANNSR